MELHENARHCTFYNTIPYCVMAVGTYKTACKSGSSSCLPCDASLAKLTGSLRKLIVQHYHAST